MRAAGYLFVLVFVSLIGGAASAQDGKGWLGADVLDVTKADADKLGWDSPHGAKLGVVAAGSPADKAGLKTGDIVVSIDGGEAETSSDVEKAIASKSADTEIRLRVLSDGHEHRVTVKLAEAPKVESVSGSALQFMLETGGHTALIRQVYFTPDATQLVSVSEDKTVRIWDLASKTLLKTLRGEVGPGSQGSLNALAVSSDGALIATGGYFNHEDEGACSFCGDVRLFDRRSGALLAALRLPDVSPAQRAKSVTSLAFSKNGRLLAAGHDNGLVVIWDVTKRAALRLLTHPSTAIAVHFAQNDSQVVTGDAAGKVRLWNTSDGALVAEQSAHEGWVAAIALHPDGRIYTGGMDRKIKEWAADLKTQNRILSTERGSIVNLAISGEGKVLVASTGQAGEGSIGDPYEIDQKVRIRVFNLQDGETSEYLGHKYDDVIPGLAFSPASRLVATGGGISNEIHVFDPEQSLESKVGSSRFRPVILSGADSGSAVTAVGFAVDGSEIAWGNSVTDPADYSGYYLNKSILGFELKLPKPGVPLGEPRPLEPLDPHTSFVRGIKSRSGVTVQGTLRKAGVFDFKVTLAGGMGVAVSGGIADYTFAPRSDFLIVSKHFADLIAYDFKGAELGRFVGHTDTILATALSPDERLMVSGGFDGTVRLWNVRTHELVTNLFVTKKGEWVMWTPQGYYIGSPGVDKIVGWQINRGPENAADYVGADQLRQHLNRPDIVEKAIILASAEQAVREAPGTTFKLADLLARPVPRFKILAPIADEVQRGGRAVVKIAVEAAPDPVMAIRAQVNGRQIAEETPDIGSGGFAAGEIMLDVPLARGKNEVRITLTNAIGEKAEVLTLNHEGEGALNKRGTLYILAIGVDKYPGLGSTCGLLRNESCDLTVSGADARALVGAVEKRLGPAHDRVVKRLLVNGAAGKDEPTGTNILDAISLLQQAEETDTVLLFIAGHGFNDGPNYRFLATNAEWEGSALRGSTVVPWYALQEAVETAKGRRILFIDTCHSGNAYNQRLGNAAYHANIIAYTAARFDQTSREDDALGHGLFTYAVLEGLEGKGGIAAHHQISTKELADYVKERVEELAKAQHSSQEPQYFKGRDAEDYVLVRW